MKGHLVSLLLFGCAIIFVALTVVGENKPAQAASPQTRTAPCPADKPLGGRVEITSDWNSGGCRGSVRYLLRFPLKEDPFQVSEEAPEIEYDMSTGGCSGTNPAGLTCHGSGALLSGKASLGLHNRSPESDGYLIFYPKVPKIDADVLLYELARSDRSKIDIECVGPQGSGKNKFTVFYPAFSIRPADKNCLNGGHVFCIQPSDYHNSVMPFIGEATWKASEATLDRGDGILSSTIHWQIGCGCENGPCQGAPGKGPPQPTPTPTCAPPTTQRALMDTTWQQRQAKAGQLEEKFKELLAANQKMQDNLSAWRAAIPTCAIEEIAEKTSEELVKGFAGERGELLEAINKMVTGDLSYMAQGEWSNLGDAMSNIRTLLGAATGAGNPKAMEEAIADCKALPQELKDGAKEFVDAYAEVKSLMPEVQTDVNDIRSLDQKYWDDWQKYYQACLEYAKCRGVPASDCPPPPSQPSGPMPGQQ